MVVTVSAVAELTAGQPRKPLLGTGSARPVGFRSGRPGGARFLAGTDGLFNDAPLESIRQVVLETDLLRVPARLLDLVRLASGALPDDVGVVVVGEP